MPALIDLVKKAYEIYDTWETAPRNRSYLSYFRNTQKAHWLSGLVTEYTNTPDDALAELNLQNSISQLIDNPDLQSKTLKLKNIVFILLFCIEVNAKGPPSQVEEMRQFKGCLKKFHKDFDDIDIHEEFLTLVAAYLKERNFSLDMNGFYEEWQIELKRNEELSQENCNLKLQNDDLREKIQQLENNQQKYDLDFIALSKQNAELTKRCEIAETRLAEANKEIAELQKKPKAPGITSFRPTLSALGIYSPFWNRPISPPTTITPFGNLYFRRSSSNN